MSDAKDTQLQGKWEQMQGRVKEAWGALSDDDVQRSDGKWDQLVGTIRERTGESIDKIEEKLNKLLDRADSD